MSDQHSPHLAHSVESDWTGCDRKSAIEAMRTCRASPLENFGTPDVTRGFYRFAEVLYPEMIDEHVRARRFLSSHSRH